MSTETRTSLVIKAMRKIDATSYVEMLEGLLL